jgi:glycerol-3-phosphate acyltransferase PlsY
MVNLSRLLMPMTYFFFFLSISYLLYCFPFSGSDSILGYICLGAYGGASLTVGAWSPGYDLAQFLFNVNLKEVGSGGTGATNAMRSTACWWMFPLVAVLDFLKAYLWLYVFRYFAPGFLPEDVVIGLFFFLAAGLLVGNVFPRFFSANYAHAVGGKGIVTSVAILALAWPLKLLAFVVAVWALMFAVSRNVGVASGIISFLVVPVYILWFGTIALPMFLLLLLMSLIIFYRHTDNLQKFLHDKGIIPKD